MTDRETTPPLTRERLTELFAHSDTTVVFDVFAEAVSTVQAQYVAAIIDAQTEAERVLWTERGVALDRFQRAVGPDNRDAMLNGILLLKAEQRLGGVPVAQSAA